jgi:hypothetical protein
MAVFFIFCSLFLYFFIFFFLVNFSSYVSIAVNTVVVDCVSTRDLSMLLASVSLMGFITRGRAKNPLNIDWNGFF